MLPVGFLRLFILPVLFVLQMISKMIAGYLPIYACIDNEEL